MFAQFLISGGLSFIKNLQTLPGLQTLMRYTSGGARKGAKSPVLWGRARTLRCQMLQCIGKSLLKNVKIMGKYEKFPINRRGWLMVYKAVLHWLNYAKLIRFPRRTNLGLL